MSAVPFDPDDGLHVSSFPARGTLWARTKAQQRALLQRGRDSFPVLVYVLATIQIQRFWRGVILRRRVLQHFLQGGFTRRWRQDEAIVRHAYHVIAKPSERELGDLATLVQGRWRTALLRHEFARWSAYDSWPIYYVAAATIQRAWVDFGFAKKQRQHRNRAKRMYASREDAMAGRLQLAWRGYVNRQVFRFYKRLVQYREGSDALLMLRTINATEAYLMDPAAGLHVRFRLGGAAFPPVVLYRIYTHRAVADIGAFAPKDYTRAPARRNPRHVHNNVNLNSVANGATQRSVMAATANAEVAKQRDRTGWYQRVENNDWRAVSEDVFAGPDSRENLPEDVRPVWEQRFARFLDIDRRHRDGQGPGALVPKGSTWRRRPQPVKFYAVAAKRRAAREHKAKQTKRRWLVELYSSEQEAHSKAARETVREDAAALFDTLTDAEVDEETQRLMEWTEHLDYDSYHTSWLRMATTAPSDALVATTAAAPVEPRGSLNTM